MAPHPRWSPESTSRTTTTPGVACPFGSHLRRSNPRNGDYPGRPSALAQVLITLGASSPDFRDDLMSPVRFHRILRRGREFGRDSTPDDALGPPASPEPERGLHFIGLNANIARQFEFLQNAWLANTTFADLAGESDPLIGTREDRGAARPPTSSAFRMTAGRAGG